MHAGSPVIRHCKGSRDDECPHKGLGSIFRRWHLIFVMLHAPDMEDMWSASLVVSVNSRYLADFAGTVSILRLY